MGTNELQDLAARLDQADDRSLTRIVGVIDRIRQRGAIDRLLDPHRPRLARIKPPRAITLERVLTLPFEDLLISDEPWSPGVVRIPRAHLNGLHGLVLAGLEPGLADTLRGEVDGHTMHDGAMVLSLGDRLWIAAGRILTAHVAKVRGSAGEARELAATARLAGAVLGLGSSVVCTLWALPPKPMTEIGATARGHIEALLAEAGTRGRDVFLIVNELILRRCENPLLILTPLLEADLPLSDRERQSIAAMVAESCLGAMRQELDLRQAASNVPLGELRGTMQRLVGGIEALEGLPQSVRFDRHALRQLKKRTFDLLETRLGEALEGALLKSFNALRSLVADSPGRTELEATAAAAAGLRLMAKKVGLASRIDYHFEKAKRTYSEILLEDRPSADATAVSPTRLMDRVRIIELLFGSQPAMALFRQASTPHKVA